MAFIKGEWLGLGVVSASVGSFLGLCLLLPGLSFRRRGIVRAGAAAAGWCTLICGRFPCFLGETGAGAGFSITWALSDRLVLLRGI